MEKENRNFKQFQEMRIKINGIKYKAVDTKIQEGMDVSCRDCDISIRQEFRVPRVRCHCALSLVSVRQG